MKSPLINLYISIIEFLEYIINNKHLLFIFKILSLSNHSFDLSNLSLNFFKRRLSVECSKVDCSKVECSKVDCSKMDCCYGECSSKMECRENCIDGGCSNNCVHKEDNIEVDINENEIPRDASNIRSPNISSQNRRTVYKRTLHSQNIKTQYNKPLHNKPLHNKIQYNKSLHNNYKFSLIDIISFIISTFPFLLPLNLLPKLLKTLLLPTNINISFIADGNRRYLKKHNKNINQTKRQGIKKINEIINLCTSLGLKEVGFYCFSIYNFKRSDVEIENVLGLFKYENIFGCCCGGVEGCENGCCSKCCSSGVGSCSKCCSSGVEGCCSSVCCSMKCSVMKCKKRESYNTIDNLNNGQCYNTIDKLNNGQCYNTTDNANTKHNFNSNDNSSTKHNYNSTNNSSTTKYSLNNYNTTTNANSKHQPPFNHNQPTFNHNPLFNNKSLKIKIYGNLSLLPQKIQQNLQTLENLTNLNKGIIVNLFIAYSSKDEIQNGIKYKDKVDLIIRTSGEKRLSDFLILNVIKGTRIVFLDVLWPEISVWHVLIVLVIYRLENLFFKR